MELSQLVRYMKEFKAQYPELREVLQEIYEEAYEEIEEYGADEHHTCELAHQSMKDVVKESK